MLYPLLNLFTLLDVPRKRGLTGLSTSKRSEKLSIDESKVPQRFMRRVVKFEVDKDAIEQALKAGEELDFAHYETSSETIVLKK